MHLQHKKLHVTATPRTRCTGAY